MGCATRVPMKLWLEDGPVEKCLGCAKSMTVSYKKNEELGTVYTLGLVLRRSTVI